MRSIPTFRHTADIAKNLTLAQPVDDELPCRGRRLRRCRAVRSKTGRIHFVSARRQRRHAYVQMFGYRPRATSRRQPPRVGAYTWLSPVEQLRIRAEAAAGVSANRIARRIGRNRRTIDRVLSDARGFRLAERLAGDRALFVLLPELLPTLRSLDRLVQALPGLLEQLRAHDDGGAVYRRVAWRLRVALRQLRGRQQSAAVVWGPACARQGDAGPHDAA